MLEKRSLGTLKRTNSEDSLNERFKEYRMIDGKNPKGNIIVDKNGNHVKKDRHKFRKIKDKYTIANMKYSRKLSEKEINDKSKGFIKILKKIFPNKNGDHPIDYISRKGQRMGEKQINKFLMWLNS